MPAPNWDAFAGVTLLVLAALIALARASQAMLAGEPDGDENGVSEDDAVEQPDDVEHPDVGERAEREYGEQASTDVDSTHTPTVDSEAATPTADSEVAPSAERSASVTTNEPVAPVPSAESDELAPGALLLNVALSQGLFGAALVGAAWFAAIPPTALGVGSVRLWEVGAGVALGVALFAANELGQRGADELGIDYEDGLREMLMPETPTGWIVLLGLVLPVIAGFEELLFRAALVGALAAGYGISPWLLALGSTVAFAVGHGAQGPGGILVTGTLGGVLAAAFVLSGSLLVVVVAHYLVNALEFVVYAGKET